MKKVRFLIAVVVVLFLVSCTSTQGPQVVQATGEPEWVFNPSVPGKVAGIGIARYNFNGGHAQRTAAIQRAIDEIARQLGVTVDSTSEITTVADRNSSASNMQSYSFQTVDGNVVTANARKWWKDPTTQELYVWMVTQ